MSEQSTMTAKPCAVEGCYMRVAHTHTRLDAERAARPGDGLREDRDRWRDEAYYQYRLRNGIATERPIADIGDVDPFARHEQQRRLRRAVVAFLRAYLPPHASTTWSADVNAAVDEMRAAVHYDALRKDGDDDGA